MLASLLVDALGLMKGCRATKKKRRKAGVAGYMTRPFAGRLAGSF